MTAVKAHIAKVHRTPQDREQAKREKEATKQAQSKSKTVACKVCGERIAKFAFDDHVEVHTRNWPCVWCRPSARNFFGTKGALKIHFLQRHADTEEGQSVNFDREYDALKDVWLIENPYVLPPRATPELVAEIEGLRQVAEALQRDDSAK
jgi:hypothetical protein